MDDLLKDMRERVKIVKSFWETKKWRAGTTRFTWFVCLFVVFCIHTALRDSLTLKQATTTKLPSLITGLPEITLDPRPQLGVVGSKFQVAGAEVEREAGDRAQTVKYETENVPSGHTGSGKQAKRQELQRQTALSGLSERKQASTGFTQFLSPLASLCSGTLFQLLFFQDFSLFQPLWDPSTSCGKKQGVKSELQWLSFQARPLPDSLLEKSL